MAKQTKESIRGRLLSAYRAEVDIAMFYWGMATEPSLLEIKQESESNSDDEMKFSKLLDDYEKVVIEEYERKKKL